MAVRNPTSFTRFVDQGELTPGKMVRTTEPTKVINDQMYVLDASRIEITDCWHNDYQYTAGVFTDIVTYHDVLKSMCREPSAGTTINFEWAVYTWCDDAFFTNWTVQLTSNTLATTSTVVINSARTAKWWRGYGTHALSCDLTEESLTLAVRRDAGAGNIFVAGFGLWAPET